jgi:hypothetical protein
MAAAAVATFVFFSEKPHSEEVVLYCGGSVISHFPYFSRNKR